MSPVPDPLSLRIDCRAYGRHLVPHPAGIWTTSGHRDVSFAYNDDTDWESIEDSSFWYQHRNQCFAALLSRYNLAGPLWEIGSGNGNVCLGLQTAGLTVVGVEPTVRSALTAHRRGVRHVVCAHIEEAGFSPGSLENLALFDVLEHIEHDGDFLRQLRGLIRPGGVLACAVPAWSALWSREDEAAGHWRRYRLDGLVRLVAQAGFRVDYATHFFAPLVLPIWLLRSLPSQLGLRPRRSDTLSRREHTLPHGVAGRALAWSLAREASQIARGQSLRVGASCLLAARAC